MDMSSLSKPEEMVRAPAMDLFALDPHEVELIRLDAARLRFEELRGRVPFLERLATNQKLDHIESLDDVVPLFFQPSVFKSYSLSFIERSQFGRLTTWLDQLTVHDLSNLDVSACDSIDGWIETLDQLSPMRIAQGTAMGGKLSFLPRSVAEAPASEYSAYQFYQGTGDEPTYDFPGTKMPVVFLGYRYGYTPGHRLLESQIETIAGSEDRCICLYPVRLSADVLSLAGRLKAADDKGERGMVELSPSLIARRDEFAEVSRDKVKHIHRFLERICDELSGQVCLGRGTWANYLEVTLEAEKLGISGVFDPASPINPGSGFGARDDIPPDWYERVCRFLGLGSVLPTYGMAEMIPYLRACWSRHYHIPPYLVPYVLDPDDSTPFPREGVRTGRLAFLDLLAETYWGGYVTGDEVTIHWDELCACGRKGAFLDEHIEQYSLKRGGDDKISCARIDDAHDRALEFLSEVP